VIIARDYLVVKKDHNHAYRICGYLDDSVLVRSEQELGYQQIYLNGKKGTCYPRIPQGTSRVLNARRLGLKRPASSRA
jgi:hypothetical protein